MHRPAEINHTPSPARLLAAAALLLCACLCATLCACNKADERPAQIELPGSAWVAQNLPGRVYVPFDGAYPKDWPEDIRLPEGTYVLGPISDEPNPKAETEQLQHTMAAYALVPGESVPLRIEWADKLRGLGFQLLDNTDTAGMPSWSGKAFRQREDGNWLAVAIHTDSDTGREGWCSLVLTVSLHKDLGGHWQGQPGSNPDAPPVNSDPPPAI